MEARLFILALAMGSASIAASPSEEAKCKMHLVDVSGDPISEANHKINSGDFSLIAVAGIGILIPGVTEEMQRKAFEQKLVHVLGDHPVVWTNS